MNAILVIDRDAETHLAARRALEAAGYAVSAEPGHGAAAPRPALVLADPAAASLATLRRRYPEARILILSSDNAASVRATRNAPATLRKPFTASELLAAVRRCLASPRA
jgi:DNA-binding response OmpR family regulator